MSMRRKIAVVVALVLGLLPIVHAWWLLQHLGAATPSSDDFRFFPLLDQILDGHYRWIGYMRDTVISNGHSIALPFLLYAACAKFADLDIRLLLSIGFGIQIANLLLATRILSFSRGILFRAWLLPLLALLLFSNSLVSMYGNSFYCLQYVLALFGFLLGVWGLSFVKKPWQGLGWAVIGGLVGSWSFAGGVLAWPIYAALMGVLGYRKWRQYLVLAVFAAIALLPYLFIPPGPDATLKAWLAPLLLAKGIGLYFTAEFFDSRNLSFGLAGFAALALNLLAWWRAESSPESRRPLYPILSVIAYSLLNFWQITLFRDYFWPWYAPVAAVFWVGVVGLGAGSLVSRGLFRRSVGGATLALVLVPTLQAAFDPGFLSRSEAIRSRAPASASCLQNYRSSPTYCQWNVAWWRPRYKELVEMGDFLERHRLIPFAPGRQSRSLQGDFVQAAVKVKEADGVPDIAFSRGLALAAIPWLDARHANLFVHSPNSVSWRIRIPADASGARLISGTAISPSAPRHSQADGAVAQIKVHSGGQETLAFAQYLAPEDRHWQDFSIPLDRWIGKEIEVEWSSDPLTNVVDDWVMYRFPRVDWFSQVPEAKAAVASPSNVEPSADFPALSPKDFIFPPLEDPAWERHDLAHWPAVKDRSGVWLAGVEPVALLRVDDNLCLANYSHLYWDIGAPILETWAKSHIARIFLEIDGKNWVEVRLPLKFDEENHAYAFDLKLLELPRNSKLSAVRLQPVEKENLNGITWLKLGELRLISNNRNSACP